MIEVLRELETYRSMRSLWLIWAAARLVAAAAAEDDPSPPSPPASFDGDDDDAFAAADVAEDDIEVLDVLEATVVR